MKPYCLSEGGRERKFQLLTIDGGNDGKVAESVAEAVWLPPFWD